MLGDLWQDLRYGARLLIRNPVLTLTVVITLTVGIGANASIFSVVNAVLLRPFPYIDENRLMAIESGDRTRGEYQMGGVSPGNYWELRTAIPSFEQIAGFIGGGYSFTETPNPETVPGIMVTPNFFNVLGATPVLGRLIAAGDTCEQCPRVIVLSYRLWQRRFGADPDIVGKILPDNHVRVIGVLPPDFTYPSYAEVWQSMPDRLQSSDRASRYFQVYGLLKPGITPGRARAELQAFAAHVEQAFPRENKNLAFALTPYRDRMAQDVRLSLLLLLGAVGAVLLITCANVANLLLSRSLARRKEAAVRSALGASRGRLLRQWLSEGVLLAVISAVCGWLLAQFARQGLLRLWPETYSYLQLKDRLQFDWRVVTFTVTTTALTALLFSLVPALQISRTAAGESIREGRGSESGQTHRVRNALVVAEVAVAFILLVGAGLLINSFLRLQRVKLGFDARNLFGINLTVPFTSSQAEKTQLIRQMQDAVAGTPDVESAAVTTGNIFPYLSFPMNRVDGPLPADEPVMYEVIGPNYFALLGGALMSGRYFTEQDGAGAEPVAVVNAALARKFFDGDKAMDKMVVLNYLGKPQQRRIVGVVHDMSQGELVKLQPQIYVPYLQQPWLSSGLVVRARTTPASASRSARNALLALNPRQSFTRVRTAEELIGEKMEEPRLYTVLLGLCGLLALLLSVAGIVGVMSYNVARRTAEIGIRMALGAQASDVLRLVLRRGMSLIFVGVILGIMGSLLLTRLMKGLLFGVSATDPLTFLLITLLLAAVALLACYFPARRAARVDPLIALRYE
jgi:putative ABC transport system permease protein